MCSHLQIMCIWFTAYPISKFILILSIALTRFLHKNITRQKKQHSSINTVILFKEIRYIKQHYAINNNMGLYLHE
jgi:hypothetical protein